MTLQTPTSKTGEWFTILVFPASELQEKISFQLFRYIKKPKKKKFEKHPKFEDSLSESMDEEKLDQILEQEWEETGGDQRLSEVLDHDLWKEEKDVA